MARNGDSPTSLWTFDNIEGIPTSEDIFAASEFKPDPGSLSLYYQSSLPQSKINEVLAVEEWG